MYELFINAPSKRMADRYLKDLIDSLRRTKRPDSDNFKWTEHLATVYVERFGMLDESLAELLSLLTLANDTTGGYTGKEKYASCTSMEYAFYSFRRTRRNNARGERHKVEFPIDPLYLEKVMLSENPEEGITQGLYLTMEVVKGMGSSELQLFYGRYIEESSVRELESDLGIPKSTVARNILRLDNKIKRRIEKFYE